MKSRFHLRGFAGASVLLMLAVRCFSAEVIDRIAATVGNVVITESELKRQVRIVAFIEGKPIEFTPAAKRATVELLIRQALIEKEMNLSRYPTPDVSDAERTMRDFKSEHYKDDAGYAQALAKHGITEEDLRQHILLRLKTARFIEFRFTQGVQVGNTEVEEYYSKVLLPELKKAGTATTPSLTEARANIEKVLIEQHVGLLLDGWLKDARMQARIEIRDEVLN